MLVDGSGCNWKYSDRVTKNRGLRGCGGECSGECIAYDHWWWNDVRLSRYVVRKGKVHPLDHKARCLQVCQRRADTSTPEM